MTLTPTHVAHSCTTDIFTWVVGGGTGEEQKIVLGQVSTLAEEIQLMFPYWYIIFLSSNYTYGLMSSMSLTDQLNLRPLRGVF